MLRADDVSISRQGHQSMVRVFGTIHDGRDEFEPRQVNCLRSPKSHCADCYLSDRCLPSGLDDDAVRCFDELIGRQRRLCKGDALFRAGTDFLAIYAIRFGSLKTTVTSEGGCEQVVGYHLPGEVIGCDGITTNRHTCNAVALEDVEICVAHFRQLEAMGAENAVLQQNIRKILGREISRNQAHAGLLRGMTAEHRVASFLLDLSERYRRLGYSTTELVLRVSRSEIGSYLGLKVETVSRIFSRLQADGYIEIQGRTVRLLHAPTLTAMLGK